MSIRIMPQGLCAPEGRTENSQEWAAFRSLTPAILRSPQPGRKTLWHQAHQDGGQTNGIASRLLRR
jgi:hypothetical protein